LVSTSASVQLSNLITFGKGTVVKPFAVIQTNKGKINIGNDCSINNFVQIANGDGLIHIGNHVRIGPNVTILGTSRNIRAKDTLIVDQGFSHDGITIEDDVLIGAGSILLKGRQISTGVVIGAGTVITENVPEYSIVVGNPARIIGKRE
jgi:acetyltransferase-like isoleucine patch superfamily enzyme